MLACQLSKKMYTNVIHVVIKLKHKDAQNYYFTSDIHNNKETGNQVFVGACIIAHIANGNPKGIEFLPQTLIF